MKQLLFLPHSEIEGMCRLGGRRTLSFEVLKQNLVGIFDRNVLALAFPHWQKVGFESSVEFQVFCSSIILSSMVRGYYSSYTLYLFTPFA